MEKILVTGGAGFIGSALVAELNKHNYDVYVVDDLSFGNREFVEVPDEKFFVEDILDKPKMEEIFNAVKPDKVVHLAAIHFIPYCNKHPYESANINITGTMNILDIARKMNGIAQFFFASTAAVYPIYDHPLPEDHPVEPLDIYGLSKLAGERLCNEFYLKSDIPVVVCRFFNAFGPNETNPHLIPVIQQQVNEGKRTIKLGNLDPKRDFIHTHDMARACRLLIEKHNSGIETFNLGSGKEYSVREIVEAFERQLGEKITIEQDPERIRKVDRKHLVADITKLKSYIDWQPEVSIGEGIKTLLDEELKLE